MGSAREAEGSRGAVCELAQNVESRHGGAHGPLLRLEGWIASRCAAAGNERLPTFLQHAVIAGPAGGEAAASLAATRASTKRDTALGTSLSRRPTTSTRMPRAARLLMVEPGK